MYPMVSSVVKMAKGKNKGIFSPLTRFPYVITISSGIKTLADLHRNGHYGSI